MKNTSRILLFLVPALLASQLCHADPLNGGIRTEDVVGALLLVIVAALVVVAAPVLSYLSYKRPGRQLNLTAWVLAIVTKLACIVLAIRSGNSPFWQWGAQLGILSNISLYLLLLKAERDLTGRRFQLAFFVHSILGIMIARSLFSYVLFPLLLLGIIHIFLSDLVMFGIPVWFVYQYLRSAAAKGVKFPAGLLHPFVWGLAITLGVFINGIFMVLFVFVISERSSLSDIAYFAFGTRYQIASVVANALLSGVVGYWLLNRKTKNAG